MPSVYSLITKWNLKKEREEFKQIGRIAIYEAWLNHEPSIGDFGPFAFSYVSGEIKKAIKKNDRWGSRHVFSDPFILTELTPTLSNEEDCILIKLLLEEYKLTEKEKIWATEGLINGLKVQEIAKVYGCSTDTVKLWRRSALKKLRKLKK